VRLKLVVTYLFYFTLLLCSGQLFSQSDFYIDSLIIEVAKAKDDTNKLLQLSIIAENADDDIWPVYNNEMGKLAAKLQNSTNPKIKLCALRHLAASLNNKGFFFTERGIAYKAVLYFNKSLAIQRAIRDLEGEAYSLSNLGAIYDSKGEIDKALEYYFAAVKIRENINSKQSLAQSYNNIAILYNNQNDLANALKYHFHSLKIRLELKDLRGIALAYNNIGSTYTNLVETSFKGKKKIPDSLVSKPYAYFNKSLGSYTLINDEHGIAHSMFNLADLYVLQADCYYEKNTVTYDTLLINAEKLFLKCFEIYTRNNEKEWLANTHNGLADVYWRQGKNNKAKTSAEQAMVYASELGYPGTIQKCAQILRQIYQSEKNFEKALAMSDMYFSMRDSVLNDKNQKETLSKYFLYQSEKQEILTKINQEKMQLTFASKTKQQNLIIYFVVFVLIVLTIFGLFMVNRFKVTQKQNLIIQQQKLVVEASRTEIVDSINYARRIQYALLANNELLDTYIKDRFIYFKPKDIVSGDFYWATEHNGKFYFAVCDCTGHGVPGAFMSLLIIGFMSEAIKEKNIEEPCEIFDYVRTRLIDSISKDSQQDGMDGILICFDTKSAEQGVKKISYSAANNTPVVCKKNGDTFDLLELPKDKMPVGKGEAFRKFKPYSIELNQGDTLYLFSDGYADQFGGPKGKKFKYKILNELLLSNAALPLNAQAENLLNEFESWKGNLEQVDDVCVVGIQV
jgi:serine phosphatase RsbU (regulator of sigma subunit)